MCNVYSSTRSAGQIATENNTSQSYTRSILIYISNDINVTWFYVSLVHPRYTTFCLYCQNVGSSIQEVTFVEKLFWARSQSNSDIYVKFWAYSKDWLTRFLHIRVWVQVWSSYLATLKKWKQNQWAWTLFHARHTHSKTLIFWKWP